MNQLVTVTQEQLELRAGARAMIAGRMVTARPHLAAKPEDITVAGAAKLLNVSEQSVSRARQLLRHGDLDMIRMVDAGRIGVDSAIKRLGITKPGKKHVGQNPSRIERRKQQLLVWKHLRDAMVALSHLPLPADVLAVARRMDRHNTILPKVPGAFSWLKEFHDVCHGEAANTDDRQPAEAGAEGPTEAV